MGGNIALCYFTLTVLKLRFKVVRLLIAVVRSVDATKAGSVCLSDLQPRWGSAVNVDDTNFVHSSVQGYKHYGCEM